MTERKGMFLGLGVGPGDPELMTLKAVRILRAAEIVAVPNLEPKQSVAYQIAKKAVPEIESKEILGLDFPMTKDRDLLQRALEADCTILRGILEQGKDVVFLTLGDPTLYSTFFHLAPLIQQAGYPITVISGVPSFCAAAAASGIPIAQGRESVVLCPEVPENLDIQEGTTVFMKPGKKVETLKRQLRIAEETEEVTVSGVENCGMASQRIFRSASGIPGDAGYFTTIILRKNGKQQQIK